MTTTPAAAVLHRLTSLRTIVRICIWTTAMLPTAAHAQTVRQSLATLRANFQRFDITEDGWLDGREVDACGCMAFDRNGDREITWDEYRAGSASAAASNAPRARASSAVGATAKFDRTPPAAAAAAPVPARTAPTPAAAPTVGAPGTGGAPQPGVYACYGQRGPALPAQFGIIDGRTYANFDAETGRYVLANGILTMTTGPMAGFRYRHTRSTPTDVFRLLDENGAFTAYNCPWQRGDARRGHW